MTIINNKKKTITATKPQRENEKIALKFRIRNINGKNYSPSYLAF